MKKVCLAIGVGDAPPLDYLRGAVNGAHAIAEWARGQGYETRLLTDEVKLVEFEDIKTALTDLLAGGAERLLLYFAGHGLSTGAADDLWLLSEWDQVRQGVSVTVLRNRLMRYGIKQLVLVSDACRTLIDANTADVTGNPVLERGPFDEEMPQMDLWFAASPSRAAWMIPGRTPDESRCVFSGLMCEALTGVYTDAFDPEDPTRGITNFSLADFMEEKVPTVAGRYGATLKPAITTAIRPPRHIYVPDGPHPPPADEQIPWPDPADVRVAGMGSADSGSRVSPGPGESWTTLDLLEATATRAPAFVTLTAVIARDGATIANTASKEREVVQQTLSVFENEKRPEHFETGAGFSLSGARVVRGLLGAPAKAREKDRIPPDTSWWRIEPSDTGMHGPWWAGGVPIRQPLPLLVGLADGRWVGAAALPGFVLSFTLDDAGAQAAIFRAMDDPHAPLTEVAMAKLRASALNREQAPELVEQLRYAKHADPMLGVLAAYLHEAMGDIANVHRTAYYYAERGEPIPFDIALLGRLAARRDPDGLIIVRIPAVARTEHARKVPGYMKNATPEAEGVLAGAFPWMRQGWALLDPEGRPDLYPAGLADLASHLQSAPFTTLDAPGGARLADLLFPTE
jgi:hypothetical protein